MKKSVFELSLSAGFLGAADVVAVADPEETEHDGQEIVGKAQPSRRLLARPRSMRRIARGKEKVQDLVVRGRGVPPRAAGRGESAKDHELQAGFREVAGPAAGGLDVLQPVRQGVVVMQAGDP